MPERNGSSFGRTSILLMGLLKLFQNKFCRIYRICIIYRILFLVITPIRPGQDCGSPPPPARTRVPPNQTGVPHIQDRIGVSRQQGQDWSTPLARTGVPPPTPRQNSRESTCYVVDGMHLPVTQEDFLFFENENFCRF